MRTLLIGLALSLVAGCGGASTPSRPVAAPPADASPETVVRTYLQALDAHDIPTARQLLTPDHAETVEDAEDGWFSNTVSITDVQLLPSYTDPDADGRHRISVPVRFDLTQRHEGSMENGPTSWDYVLVQQGGRWLITDEGTG